MPFKEDALWDGYPEETNAPYGLAKKMLLVQSQAYRASVRIQLDLSPAREPLRPVGQLRPRVLSRDSCADSQVFRGGGIVRAAEIVVWGDGSPTREFLYVDDAAEGIVLAAERSTRASR